MKKPEEVMEILEAYDLAGTLRGAALLAGVVNTNAGGRTVMADGGPAECGTG